VLENYIRWVVEFRSLCVRHGLEGRAVEIAAQAAPDVSDVEALKDAAAGVLVVLGKLHVAVGWPEDYLTKAPLAEITADAQAMRPGRSLLNLLVTLLFCVACSLVLYRVFRKSGWL